MRLMMSASALAGLLAACSTALSPSTGDDAVALETPSLTPQVETSQPITDEDPFLWLEEVEGDQALAWVRSQNARSLGELESRPDYADNLAKATAIATSDERIAYGTIRDGYVYNFWQDETNTRGLWRRTSQASYETATPDWEIVLDFDQLSAEEDQNWVYKGADCFRPKRADRTLCMVSLSNGGKDAIIKREFDLETKTFVEGGFVTAEAKQGTAWIDQDTMLVATDWGGDGSTLTSSGYPSQVKLWKRGQALEDAALVYSGDASHVGVWPWSVERADGTVIYGAVEADTFFTSQYWLLSGETPVQFPIPAKSSLGSEYKGWQFVTLQEDWDVAWSCEASDACEPRLASFQSGDLVAFRLQDFIDTGKLSDVQLVFRANDRQAVNGVSVAKGTALLSINDNVASKILKLDYDGDTWTTSEIALPGSGQASVSFADKDETTVFINYEGFLTPDSLLKYDVPSQTLSPLKSLPVQFDTQDLVVHQREATSTDGTRIPYFVVHKRGIAHDGKNPTLIYGYGGFEVSERPSYSATIGQLWLEKGGVYILANIRGGGEFGPDWHQAGLKGNRQRIYDDFIAVAEDMIDHGVTSPEHLGIMGGSNGGLLMGVMLTQRPDLWNAVVIQVPLLDMLRYHKLLAGASWIGEYGDPEIAEERAFLATISPYHNFNPADDYPTPFFVTSTKDDRVHPGHARKMAALFEQAGHDFLYYENIDGGHSAAANQTERARRSALEFTYLAERLFPAPEAD